MFPSSFPILLLVLPSSSFLAGNSCWASCSDILELLSSIAWLAWSLP